MKNKTIIILSISIVCTLVLLNQKSTQLAPKNAISSTSENTEIEDKVAPNHVMKVSNTKIKKEKEKSNKQITEISNSKVSSLLIQHFDDEFGSQIKTKIKVIGDKLFNKRAMKVVRISHQKQTGLQSSYLAIVNPDTGKILKTWSKSKIEKFRPDPNDFVGFRLPSSN